MLAEKLNLQQNNPDDMFPQNKKPRQNKKKRLVSTDSGIKFNVNTLLKQQPMWRKSHENHPIYFRKVTNNSALVHTRNVGRERRNAKTREKCRKRLVGVSACTCLFYGEKHNFSLHANTPKWVSHPRRGFGGFRVMSSDKPNWQKYWSVRFTVGNRKKGITVIPTSVQTSQKTSEQTELRGRNAGTTCLYAGTRTRETVSENKTGIKILRLKLQILLLESVIVFHVSGVLKWHKVKAENGWLENHS